MPRQVKPNSILPLGLLVVRKAFTSLWLLGIGTLILFPAAAWLVCLLTDQNFMAMFAFEIQDLYTVPTFLSAGIFFGLAIIWLTELEFFEDALSRYRDMLQGLQINRFQAFFLSACAGIGEEIFFRGTIQPLIGIWITAVLFVAIHGYFSFTSWKVNFFAVALTLFIALLGWSAIEYSLWHAIAGHFSYDLVLLMYHRYKGAQES